MASTTYEISQIQLPDGNICTFKKPAVATASAAGLMSASDKAKLDTLAAQSAPVNIRDTGDTVTITV
ncbi:MAG: hypothetical protein MR519_10730 [Spirochaetaceae bacterium]|nr:hypothetical protein [Spirochaetaceae bacterium]